MKVVLAGGGSGGHITPLLAVADKLRATVSGVEIVHIGQKGDQLDDVMQHPSIDKSIGITAGKFRRYNGESVLSHILDIKTVLLNVRDLFRFMRGTIQAWRQLRRIKPDAILLKGGYVCVPVGLAARILRIPYMTHDSDAIPGLANRITSKHAVYNAVAMPVEGYPYSADKVVQTGIPIRPEFEEVTRVELDKAKLNLGYSSADKVLFVVGGGLGARNVNMAISQIAQKILKELPELNIIQITGKNLYEETKQQYDTFPENLHKRVKLIGFTADLYKYSSAADVVVSRAGATNIAEFAAQKKPVILIPNPVLTGGQQLHNAEIALGANAAAVVGEGDTNGLEQAISHMFALSDNERLALGEALYQVMPKRDAAQLISEMLISLATDINVKDKL